MTTKREGEEPDKRRDRIERKLASSWAAWRPEWSDKRPSLLYRCGAYTETLPLLEDPKTGFPGMFNQIAQQVSKEQRRQMLAESSLRRSKRNKVGRIECICRFTHDGPSVKCEECGTWQHLLCCYGIITHDNYIIPNKYFCENCREEPSVDIKAATERVRVVPEYRIAHLDHGKIVANSTSFPPDLRTLNITGSENTTFGPFLDRGDDTLFWGLTSRQIQAQMTSALYRIQDVVFDVMEEGLNCKKIRQAVDNKEGWDHDSYILTPFGNDLLETVSELTSLPKPPPIRVARLLMGLVSHVAIESTFYPCKANFSSTDAMLCQMTYRNILEKHGTETLRQLRTRSLFRLVNAREERFFNAAAQEAEKSTRLVMLLLLSMIPTVRNVDDYLAHSKSAKAWEESLKTMFMDLFDMKVRLAISECFYEFRMLSIDTPPSRELMVDELEQLVLPDTSIDVCLLPAVIEFDPSARSKTIDDMLILPMEEIFVRDIPLDKGKVVSPAKVALLQEEHEARGE